MPILVQCERCGKQENVTPTRAKTYRHCSHKCYAEYRSVAMAGDKARQWQGGKRTKVCESCGAEFAKKPTRAMSLFREQRFCCHACGVEGRNISGEHNPNWKGGRERQRERPYRQHAWSSAVISRDNATCCRCGATGVELHAHHIKSFKTHPDMRWDISNGETLCYKCHWAEHSTADNVNAVKTGEALAGSAEGNPVPSLGGNIREGVTTRGRAYRRWEGHCANCGKFLSKRLSDVTGKSYVACSYSCASTHRQRLRRSTAVTPPRARHAKAKI